MNRKTFNYIDPEVVAQQVAIQKLVKELVEDTSLEEKDVKAACFLLLGAAFGTDVDVVGRLAGCSREEARKFGRICRNEGIWVKGQTHALWFEQDEGGVVALICDVLVLGGLLTRKP